MQSVYAVKRAFLVYYENPVCLKRRKSPEPLEILNFYIGGDGGAPPLSLPLLAHTARSSGRLRYAGRENASLWRFLVRPSSPFELLPKVKRSPFGDLLLWWGWRGSNPRPLRCERSALTSWATSPTRIIFYIKLGIIAT